MIHCVDPASGACFDTIQGAIAAAAAGDTVRIFPKADGSAYNETVVNTTANLTVEGSAVPAT